MNNFYVYITFSLVPLLGLVCNSAYTGDGGGGVNICAFVCYVDAGFPLPCEERLTVCIKTRYYISCCGNRTYATCSSKPTHNHRRSLFIVI